MKNQTGTGNNKRWYSKALIKALVILAWILIWEGLSIGVGQELLVPSPVRVFSKLTVLMTTLSFWEIVIVTVFRILTGFVAGTAAGVAVAILTCMSSVLNAFLKPVLNIVKATPVASFIILALVWIQGGQIPAFISFLMVFPIVWGNVVKGIQQTDPKLLEMANVFRLSKTKIITKIYFHSVLPYFIPAVMTSMGLAWKAGIAAEVLSTPQLAIGTAIYDAKIYLETVDLFAWSAVVIAVSVLLESMIALLLRKITPAFSEQAN